MALLVQRHAHAIEIRGERIDFALDLDGLVMRIAGHDGAVALSGFAPRVITEAGVLAPGRAHVDGHGEIRTRHGVAQRLEARAACDAERELRLRVDVGESWRGVVLELALHGPRAPGGETLVPLAWSRGGAARLRLPCATRSLTTCRLAWRAGTPCTRPRLRARRERLARDAVDAGQWHPRTPCPGRRRHVSHAMTTLRAPNGSGLTLGFVTQDQWPTHVEVVHGPLGVRALATRAVCDEPPGPEDVHAPRIAERLWIGVDALGEDGVATWAEHCAREMHARVPRRTRSIWSLSTADPGSLGATLGHIGDAGLPVDAIEVPDGDTGRALVRVARLHGRTAAVRLAPFLTEADGALARAHPDWLLADASGTPCDAPHGSGRSAVLDPSHPEVGPWLEARARDLREQGFDALVLQGLPAVFRGVPRGARSGVEAYRLGLAALRTGAGDDAHLCGVDAPLVPSVGLLDSIQVAPDPDPARLEASPRAAAAHAAEWLARCVDAWLGATPLQGRLWRQRSPPIPPAVLDHLDPASAATLLDALALLAGEIAWQGELTDALDETRARALRGLLPPLGRRGVRIGRIDGCEGVAVHAPDGSAWLLLLNRERRAHRVRLPSRALGLPAQVHAWDATHGQSLGGVEDGAMLARLAARESRLLRLSPKGDRPRVVGTTLHRSAGGVETHRLRAANAPGAVLLELRLPGSRDGRVALVLGDTLVETYVVFDDAATIRVEGARIEQTG